jgi:hypothetical protein
MFAHVLADVATRDPYDPHYAVDDADSPPLDDVYSDIPDSDVDGFSQVPIEPFQLVDQNLYLVHDFRVARHAWTTLRPGIPLGSEPGLICLDLRHIDAVRSGLPFPGLAFPVMLWCGNRESDVDDQKCLCAISNS